ncbi:MAG: hypothetical protein M1820_000880 [Bogoriella megaspora]|nr:MAG: hypothetical protein M1820_000880 [Bogoriella megaspora]
MADDDEADPELVALLRQSLFGRSSIPKPTDTGVLSSAEFIYSNSIDVAIDMYGTKRAAAHIWQNMQQREYGTKNWAEHGLHPKTKDESTLCFIFTMDLLNFCFWSDNEKGQKFTVYYKEKNWTGYWALIAALQRALEEGIPITSPFCWYMKRTRTIPRHKPAIPELQAEPEAVEVDIQKETKLERPEDPTIEEDVEALTLEERQPDDVSTTEAKHEHAAQLEQPEQDTDSQIAESSITVDEEPRNEQASTQSSGAASISPQDQLETHAETDEIEEEIFLSKELLQHILRSATSEQIPLLDERLNCLHEAGKVLHEQFNNSIVELVQRANKSAAKLVILLAEHFPCFRDESRFERKKVKFYKRAQIFVADLWAAFDGQGFGEFHDIDKLTMFAGT